MITTFATAGIASVGAAKPTTIVTVMPANDAINNQVGERSDFPPPFADCGPGECLASSTHTPMNAPSIKNQAAPGRFVGAMSRPKPNTLAVKAANSHQQVRGFTHDFVA